MPEKKFMQFAIEKAKEGIRDGQTPFSACIVKDSEVISCTHNAVWKSNDATAHAKINAIREACKKLNSIDLSACVIYSTTEPCPMCFSACHWARISKITCGTSIGDFKKHGFNELCISNSSCHGRTTRSEKKVGTKTPKSKFPFFFNLEPHGKGMDISIPFPTETGSINDLLPND